MTAAPEALTLDDPAYFHRLARAESAHWWSLGLWKLASLWLDSALKGRSALAALDIGCGAGGTLQRLALRPEIASLVGLDPSPSALAFARSHSRSVLHADATALPFPDASFDLVTCLDVWQHLPPGGDLACALEIHRVLRPNGVLLLRTNGRGLRPTPSRPAPYTLSHVIQLLRTSGFTLRRASYANCLPSVAQEVLGLLRGSSSSGPAHPSGSGLRLHQPPTPLALLMTAISSFEALLAGRLRVPLPVGHSTMALATTH